MAEVPSRKVVETSDKDLVWARLAVLPTLLAALIAFVLCLQEDGGPVHAVLGGPDPDLDTVAATLCLALHLSQVICDDHAHIV